MNVTDIKERLFRSPDNRVVMRLNKTYKVNNRWWFSGERINLQGVWNGCCIRKADLERHLKDGLLVPAETVGA